MKQIVIIGFGGFGREVAWLAKDCGRSVLGFLDDKAEPGLHGAYNVLGKVAEWKKFANAEFVVAIGSPRVRKKVVDQLLSEGLEAFATLVHPSVMMDESVKVGKGTVICAGTIATVDISIGEHVILNLNVTVAPMVALSGNVTLFPGAEVGTGAAIRQGVEMAAGSMLGMGGVLTKNTEENTIYIGSPAKVFKPLPEFI